MATPTLRALASDSNSRPKSRSIRTASIFSARYAQNSRLRVSRRSKCRDPGGRYHRVATMPICSRSLTEFMVPKRLSARRLTCVSVPR
jgi:hypothetical protein